MSSSPNYLQLLVQLADRLQLRPGSVVHVAVDHDDWCAFRRAGVCDCAPDVRVIPAPPPARGAA